ncbi:MAG TPA: phospholipase D family protein [Gemmataceae bacterium]|jgi:phosphatidylserine/phosphatidylglycerophosphate/cardiolipin synthase-like enzyme|nr:phospholipase D family protein [Gemmataceae bacterium]
MFWLLLSTGFTGGMTFLYVVRWIGWWLAPPAVLDVHFSPKGGCADRVVNEIHKARREVLVQAYSFTSKVITEALIAAHKRGVTVEVVLDHSNEKEEHTDLGLLEAAGLKPLVDAKHAIAHNKVMVIDRRTVLTGSFNFTNQAERENAENLLVVHHHRDLVASYRQNFEQHRGHARQPEKIAAAPARRAA